MPGPNWNELSDFFHQVEGRMAKGEREYGDTSFSVSPGRLAIEIREELEDVAGWSYIMWRRLVEMQNRTRDLDKLIKEQEARLADLNEALQGR